MSSVALRHLPAALCVEEDGEDLRKAQQAIYLLYLLSEKKAGALQHLRRAFKQRRATIQKPEAWILSACNKTVREHFGKD
eukprot:2521059-Rhodomonas_salina.1